MSWAGGWVGPWENPTTYEGARSPAEAAWATIDILLRASAELTSTPVHIEQVPQGDPSAEAAAVAEDVTLPAIFVQHVDPPVVQMQQMTTPGAYEFMFYVMAMVDGKNFPFELQRLIQSAIHMEGVTEYRIDAWTVKVILYAPKQFPGENNGRPLRQAGGQYIAIVRPAG